MKDGYIITKGGFSSNSTGTSCQVCLLGECKISHIDKPLRVQRVAVWPNRCAKFLDHAKKTEKDEFLEAVKNAVPLKEVIGRSRKYKPKPILTKEMMTN